MPSQHLSGRNCDSGSGAARAFRRSTGTRRQLFLLRRRRSARDHGPARFPQAGRDDRSQRSAARPPDAGSCQGRVAGFVGDALWREAGGGRRKAGHPTLYATLTTRGCRREIAQRHSPRGSASGTAERRACESNASNHECRSRSWRNAVRRDRKALRRRRSA